MHSFNRSDRTVGNLTKGELGVDLVGNNENVRVAQNRGNGFKVCLFHNGTRGVAGVGQNERLGARCNGSFELLCGQLKGVFCLGFNNDGLATAKSGDGLVANVTGLGNNDFIAGGSDCADAGVNGFGAANGYENFAHRVIGNAVFSFDVVADFLAQDLKAAVRCIAGLASLKREDARLANFPRGGKIRLANTQGDNVLHGVCNVKEFTNARRLNTHNCGGE